MKSFPRILLSLTLCLMLLAGCGQTVQTRENDRLSPELAGSENYKFVGVQEVPDYLNSLYPSQIITPS